jgi:hypothetical protein
VRRRRGLVSDRARRHTGCLRSTGAALGALRLAGGGGAVPSSGPAFQRFHTRNPMKTFTFALGFALSVLSSAALANAHKEAPNMAKAGASAPMSAQQTKMATCNSEAGDKKGEERKAFMKTCLSSKPVSQQDKMKTCNQEATGKKGDERKAFMKQCLSK